MGVIAGAGRLYAKIEEQRRTIASLKKRLSAVDSSMLRMRQVWLEQNARIEELRNALGVIGKNLGKG